MQQNVMKIEALLFTHFPSVITVFIWRKVFHAHPGFPEWKIYGYTLVNGIWFACGFVVFEIDNPIVALVIVISIFAHIVWGFSIFGKIFPVKQISVTRLKFSSHVCNCSICVCIIPLMGRQRMVIYKCISSLTRLTSLDLHSFIYAAVYPSVTLSYRTCMPGVTIGYEFSDCVEQLPANLSSLALCIPFTFLFGNPLKHRSHQFWLRFS